ncbi:MAG: hypothetical protein QGI34_09185, partial [Candidatus Latescibacteria bacterium]|nr:hypothetical protein [Candidatus Latescibacterota bacterium]
CLGVGTACGWCRPFLEKMHRQWKDGDKIEVHAEKSSYANRREAWKASILPELFHQAIWQVQ